MVYVGTSTQLISGLPERLRLLYMWISSGSHEEFYREHMRSRLADDPENSVGGFNELVGCENVGVMQLEFLKENGLSPDDRLLEIGCGVLRAGEHFINYLDAGNYVGLDISPEAIAIDRERLSDDLIAEKSPRTQPNVDLRFQELRGETFDVAISNSVFSHIPSEDIIECFEHIGDVLEQNGRYYTTFKPKRFDEL
jgi:SAM-dependent methyltransferase